MRTANVRSALIWVALGAAILGPVILAAFSPLLAWRQPVYIIAGFSGILGLALMLLQPLLAAGLLPGLQLRSARKLHKVVGLTLVAAVLTHVVALWITSPPDVIDALLLSSPTPFSIWGVIAMWALFGAAALVVVRKSLRLRWTLWRAGHVTLVTLAVTGTVVHALLIEGTMETFSKITLCVFVAVVLGLAIFVLRSRRAVPPGSRPFQN